MSSWGAQDWAIFLGAIGGFIIIVSNFIAAMVGLARGREAKVERAEIIRKQDVAAVKQTSLEVKMDGQTEKMVQSIEQAALFKGAAQERSDEAGRQAMKAQGASEVVAIIKAPILPADAPKP